MAGIADVAALAGVSKATASRALSGAGYVSQATRARVQDAATRLGYVPSTSAVSLATGRTQNIGVVMPYLNRWFFAEVLEGIQQALLERGLDLTLYDAKPGSPGRARIFDDFLARKRFDGLIAVGLEPVDREIDQLTLIGRPIVSVVGSGKQTSVVAVDDDLAARRATEHLIELGHRNIAFVGGSPRSHWAHVDQERLAGYRHAMRQAGLSQFVQHAHSEVTMPGGYAAAADLLGDARNRPTAIVGVCDEVAIGAMIAARRLGILVPSALSVVGIDDHEFAEMFALTTLRQVPREQGMAAVEVLLAEIDDPNRQRTHLRMPARLIMRTSTAPLSAPAGG
ncbi:MAG: transcriptional regulator [Microbacterium sp. SCN 70-200]|uniref:LacI family DNA-binding transcriptional regulator n=1 Tax=unclassified Microbacterium TaxID=2609290 RepID=UPI000869672A|nr:MULTISPECIES: LacI family DNA-binding transcriptional regulator [unclassified Microbacterium]MBN9213701.1 LacI family DNA-binding transcriptional regulator [Microbacterium sp.]ODT40099.1 MAG: transcriptional regulator [Microbacterium sp. SCN 70-200]OJV79213.1 MAG: LacI family transcriptional regulator [Microbacterium sp. 70-16]